MGHQARIRRERSEYRFVDMSWWQSLKTHIAVLWNLPLPKIQRERKLERRRRRFVRDCLRTAMLLIAEMNDR